MNDVLILLAAVLPGILLSIWIYYKDRFEKETKTILILVFLAGGIATSLALFFESYLINDQVENAEDIWSILYLSFIGVAIPEELAKLMVFMLFPYQLKHFNEKMDGIVFYVMIAMGFATVENLLYIDYIDSNWNLLVRAFTAVPAHASFAVIAGYFAGQAKIDQSEIFFKIAKGFFLAVLFHGLYDFFILLPNFEKLGFFAIITLIISIIYAYKLIKLHVNSSGISTKKYQNPFL